MASLPEERLVTATQELWSKGREDELGVDEAKEIIRGFTRLFELLLDWEGSGHLPELTQNE
ncbi:MAG: hypothetical protein IIB00_02775 [candidate division Zixibacteria bacterium]|nr:hypothetical protein [candidate division Zixibacteria bacterium]